MIADATYTASKFSDVSDRLGAPSTVYPYCSSSSGTTPFAAKQQIIGRSSYENGKVSNWLDAMRALSPSRQRQDQQQQQQEQQQSSSPAVQYAEWLETHPSALESFSKLMEGAERKKIAIFLDYDGTLSPIVENPEQAFMSDEMRAAVKQVAAHFPTAIISGRGRHKVKNFVQLSELYYAGSHGMDIMGPVNDCNGIKVEGTRAKDENGNDVVVFQPASEFLPTMNEVYDLLVERVKEIPGASVENNTFCLTIHFRRVSEENWPRLAEEVQNVMKDYPKLRLTQGRKVLEVRPSIDWHKGDAVEYLCHLLGLEDADSLPIYIGDDRTDEDAFNVFKKRQIGRGILVSRVPKDTSASFSLRDPPEVMKFLHTLVEWSSLSREENTNIDFTTDNTTDTTGNTTETTTTTTTDAVVEAKGSDDNVDDDVKAESS